MLSIHKFKRKFSRKKKMRNHNNQIVYGNQKKDFAWQGKKENPLKNQKNDLSSRIKLQLFLLFISLTTLMGILTYHPFFKISKITIDGIERLPKEEVVQSVQGLLSYNKYFILPANNYFLIDKKEIENLLKKRFPLNKVKVLKNFPDNLSINIEERLSTIIYNDGNMYYFMGQTGKIIETIKKVTEAEWHKVYDIVTSTNDTGEEFLEKKEVYRYYIPDTKNIIKDFGKYPIIVRQTDKTATSSLEVNTKILEESEISYIVKWYDILDQKDNFYPEYIDISSPYKTIFYTSGPELYISLADGEDETQISRFNTALQKISDSDIHKVSYIDVRFLGRVYWR